MPAPKNIFKAALPEGRMEIGCWVGMADAYAAEIAGTAGFDWLLIDGEHAPTICVQSPNKSQYCKPVRVRSSSACKTVIPL